MHRIRNAITTEGPVLEPLQRRSSDVWEEYCEQLAAHPDAIEFPQHLIDKRLDPGRLLGDYTPTGLSVVIPGSGATHELDGLFVEPAQMAAGVGRALIQDAVARASKQGAESLEVATGPAQALYEKVGFNLIGAADTRFGPAVRMRRDLHH